MAKSRSPNYPVIGLPEAIKQARKIWEKERHGRMSREVAVKHMGYTGLHGGSMGVVSALGKYGLLEGKGDQLRLSPAALTILHDPQDSAERKKALRAAASAPALFKEIQEGFPDHTPSEENLRAYLLKRGFIPGAALAVNRAYRETMELVEGEARDYNEPQVASNGDRGGSMQADTPSAIQPPAPRASLAPPPWEGDVPPVTFPLPRGNAIEIRLKSKVTPSEFEQLRQLFELLKMSVVEE